MAGQVLQTVEEALEALKKALQNTHAENLDTIVNQLKEMTGYLQSNVNVTLDDISDPNQLSPSQLAEKAKQEITAEAKPAPKPSAPQPSSAQTLLASASQQLQQANSILNQMRRSRNSVNPLFGTRQEQQNSVRTAANQVVNNLEQAADRIRRLPARLQQNFVDDVALNQTGGLVSERVIANREELGVNPGFRWRIAMDSKVTDQLAAEQSTANQTAAAERQASMAPTPQPGSASSDEADKKSVGQEVRKTAAKEALIKGAEKLTENSGSEIEKAAGELAAKSKSETVIDTLKEAEKIAEELFNSKLPRAFSTKNTPTGK